MTVWRPFQVHDSSCLALVANERGVCEIRFDGTPPAGAVRDDASPLLQDACGQLQAYFRGELRAFDVPLDLTGTPFQKSVWSALLNIPYGETRSYAFIAKTIGSPDAVRAVGAANGQNPVPIVVPCHRVIGSNGKLTGFGGGLPMKRLLLDLELGKSVEGLLAGS